MSTEIFFSEELAAFSKGKIDGSIPSVKIELLISSSSGKYEPYFKLIENDHSERVFRLSREQLEKMHQGVHAANNQFPT